MAIVYYYAPMSSAVRTTWAIEELGLACERRLMNLEKKETREHWFLDKNPNGKVPVLEVDGVPLCESTAILIYLGETHGVDAGLFPGPGIDRGRVLQWMLWAQVTLAEGVQRFARNTSSHREMTDLVGLVEEVLVLTDKDLSKHRIHLDKRFHGRPRACVVPAQIEQVLLNLIINARQAMPRGGHLRLEVRENPEAGMVELKVSDTGIGIPPDRLRLIFEPFYTTKEPDASGHGGTGLGLSVCRQIIEQHQGRIRVESLIGKGSKFIVKLPMGQEAEPKPPCQTGG